MVPTDQKDGALSASQTLDIDLVRPPIEAALLDGLADLLQACVEAGASVNFVMPFTNDQAKLYWQQKVFPGVHEGLIDLLVARDPARGGTIVGTVMINRDTPPNQPHRADVAKLLVHPLARRRGVGRALMNRLEDVARASDLKLLVLDTRTGDTAEPLYRSMGYQTLGSIPGFSLDPLGSGRLDASTFMFKPL
ncbi:MAG: GNAT family N-acetyltransferase [Rhodospirillaceae bacterium]